jgi:hypothetical protein
VSRPVHSRRGLTFDRPSPTIWSVAAYLVPRTVRIGLEVSITSEIQVFDHGGMTSPAATAHFDLGGADRLFGSANWGDCHQWSFDVRR